MILGLRESHFSIEIKAVTWADIHGWSLRSSAETSLLLWLKRVWLKRVSLTFSNLEMSSKFYHNTKLLLTVCEQWWLFHVAECCFCCEWLMVRIVPSLLKESCLPIMVSSYCCLCSSSSGRSLPFKLFYSGRNALLFNDRWRDLKETSERLLGTV